MRNTKKKQLDEEQPKNKPEEGRTINHCEPNKPDNWQKIMGQPDNRQVQTKEKEHERRSNTSQKSGPTRAKTEPRGPGGCGWAKGGCAGRDGAAARVRVVGGAAAKVVEVVVGAAKWWWCGEGGGGLGLGSDTK